ncbi:hypothetical protein [Pseudalkalibacillus hwajinpoensis]|uniref:hypothetical protein n=1 Tax=Guptibacillus hwajinpoensis TaxID=208199 RepID=UPI001CFCE4C6|nr:hypothetical protein [Pseudalkalibacillus hwajinpoensis]
MIGFSIIFLTVLGAIAIFTLMVTPKRAVRKHEIRTPPRKISYVVLGLLVFHWVFFLSSGYALLSTNMTDAIFMPVWIVLSVAGLVIAIYEFKNNKGFSLLLAGLTTISLLFSIFINGISNM